MKKKTTVFGILRERSHSPMREFDDEAILIETARKLSVRLGVDVPLLHPEEFLETGLDMKPDLIFFMCEEEPCLDRLEHMEESLGCLLVNTVSAVKNTFRRRMLSVFSDEDFFPESRIAVTKGDSWQGLGGGVWIKRGDFHAIESKDVVFARNDAEARHAVGSFLARGIEEVVIQRHIPGDIIKFYSVTSFENGKEYWFKWFYHKDQDLKEYRFSQRELRYKCQKAGMLLELEIFGGDAIVRPDGKVFIIDINAWPSFALFRKEASCAICSLLEDRLLAGRCSLPLEVTGREAGACSPTP